MSKFQLILTTIFVLVIMVGVVTFSLFSTSSGTKSGPRLVIWGTLDARLMDTLVSTMRQKHQIEFNFDYIQKDQSIFDQSLVEALAVGSGPDLLILPQDEILKNADKLYTIPFASLPERSFLDTYTDEGRLYLTSAGILGIPFVVDPLVMYWNRDLVTGAGFTGPASNWNELFTQIPSLTVKDSAFNVTTSAIAMGEWSNVRYSKEILSALIVQAGNTIVARGPGPTPGSADIYRSILNEAQNSSIPPAPGALGFFTEFSNPAKSTYSWNRSLRDSQTAFLAGDLVYYLGFASEFRLLRAKNPNLNYDIAMFPQVLGTQKRTTFGKMQAIALVKRSPNITAAFALIASLTSAETVTEFTAVSGLAPARRDLLASAPNDSYIPVIYKSALFANAWLDPDNVKTDAIFRQMASEVTTGGLLPSQAVTKASQELGLLLGAKNN